MRLALKPHPDTPSAAVTAIEVEVSRHDYSDFEVRYVVHGDIGALCLPPSVVSRRADDLWKHTCFEAFVRAWPGNEYHEYNFSPSGEWAAYDFADYRTGMTVAERATAPRIEVISDRDRLDVLVAFHYPWVLIGHATPRMAISAVIEETSGAKSYWALKHPPGKPDFHHADSFALELQ